MTRKKGVCKLESGHYVRADLVVREDPEKGEATYAHPFTGELCKTVELDPDETKNR
jgi:hypothetical protein